MSKEERFSHVPALTGWKRANGIPKFVESDWEMRRQRIHDRAMKNTDPALEDKLWDDYQNFLERAPSG